jgi:hypothetical protein
MNTLPLAASSLLAATVAAQNPALTIYNQNFAVVRERLTLDLVQGVNDVVFPGVTTQLEPDSVVLRDPTARVPFTILEQSYRADTASQQALLRMFEGKELDFLVFDHQQQTERTVRGRLLRAPVINGYGAFDNEPIVEVGGALRFSLPGKPLFPPFGADTILAPTLDWRLHAGAAAKFDAEVGYVTGGLRWIASYNLVAPEHGDLVDVVGWITIENTCGKTFRDATIKLMAGDVNKVTPSEGPRGRSPAGPDVSAGVSFAPRPQVTEKAFDEFHLYSLPMPMTLHDRQQKQVEFVRATNVEAPACYVYHGASWSLPGWSRDQYPMQRDHGTPSNQKVWVMRALANTKANGLGIPLPAGRTRFYRRDDADQRLEFVGENTIDHTPADELLRIYTGDAFDLVGERKATDFKSAANEMEEAFEIRVRNHKDKAVEVRVFERLWRWGNWNVIEKSHDFVQLDAASIEFRVQVPASGETVVTFRVRYRW